MVITGRPFRFGTRAHKIGDHLEFGQVVQIAS